jgi:hypothetical protein
VVSVTDPSDRILSVLAPMLALKNFARKTQVLNSLQMLVFQSYDTFSIFFSVVPDSILDCVLIVLTVVSCVVL